MAEGAEEKKFKIGEVCRLADVQPYVLRYWETEFPSLAPGKSGGGQRLYTQREIDTILRIKQLLYTEGFTIAGAKKKLEEEPEASPPAHAPPAHPPAAPPPENTAAVIRSVRKELQEILRMLRDD